METPELRLCPTVPRWLIGLVTALQQLKSKSEQHDLPLVGLWRCPDETSFPCPAPVVHITQQADISQSMKPIQWGQGLSSMLEWETFPPTGCPFGMWMRSRQQRPAQDPAPLHPACCATRALSPLDARFKGKRKKPRLTFYKDQVQLYMAGKQTCAPFAPVIFYISSLGSFQ